MANLVPFRLWTKKIGKFNRFKQHRILEGNYRVHDCRMKIFRDSSKELFSDQLFNAEQIGKDIDPSVREYIFENKPEVIP